MNHIILNCLILILINIHQNIKHFKLKTIDQDKIQSNINNFKLKQSQFNKQNLQQKTKPKVETIDEKLVNTNIIEEEQIKPTINNEIHDLFPIRMFTSRIIKLKSGQYPIEGTYQVQFYLSTDRLVQTSENGENGEILINDEQFDFNLYDCLFQSPPTQLEEEMLIVQLDPDVSGVDFQTHQNKNLKKYQIRLNGQKVLPNPDRIGQNLLIQMEHNTGDPFIHITNGIDMDEYWTLEEGFVPEFSGQGKIYAEIPNSLCTRGPVFDILQGDLASQNIVGTEIVDENNPDPKIPKKRSRNYLIKKLNVLFQKLNKIEVKFNNLKE